MREQRIEGTVFSESMDGLTIDEVVRRKEFSMQVNHFHDTYELYFLMEGERYYFIEQETYHVKRGDVVLVNRQQIHKTSQAGGAVHDRILLQMDGRRLNPYICSAGLMSLEELFAGYYGVTRLSEDSWEEARSLLYAIRDEIDGHRERYEVMARLKLCQLLLLISRCRTSSLLYDKPATVQTARHNKVHEVAEYLTSHCESEESLADLARRFYVSKSYLSRIFRDVTGFSVNEYRNLARVKRAEKLLSGSSYSITEISELLGFQSVTYFERVFKKHADMTPMQFKKSCC